MGVVAFMGTPGGGRCDPMAKGIRPPNCGNSRDPVGGVGRGWVLALLVLSGVGDEEWWISR